jgi:hypothetical protein
MRDLDELVQDLHDLLDAGGFDHAFGGALALGQIIDPRGTVDVDVNVFVEPSSMDRISASLEPLGFERSTDDLPIAGVRFRSSVDPFPIAVFPSLDERYREIQERIVEGSIGSRSALLPFLSAVDLCVFKLSFGRPKDWVDLAEIAKAVPDLDVDVVEDLLVGLRGPTMYPRVARFRAFFELGG